MTKKTLEDVIDGLKNLKKSSSMLDSEPIVTYGDSTFTVDQVIEALEKAGIQLGLNEKTAHLLAIQTAFGASKMALESDDSPEILRKKVTSPGGTTEKAIGILQAGKLEELFAKALAGAKDRSIELAEVLGKTNG